MNPIEHIAKAALSGDALGARSLVQDWLRTVPVIGTVPPPEENTDLTVAALAAALVELLASRLGQLPPAWAAAITRDAEPIYLLKSASRMRRLREMCLAEAPLPLRSRHFYAPANYLQAV